MKTNAEIHADIEKTSKEKRIQDAIKGQFYVGVSKNMARRRSKHRRRGLKGFQVLFVAKDMAEGNRAEGIAIKFFLEHKDEGIRSNIRNCNGGGGGGQLNAGSLDSTYYVYIVFDPERIVDPAVGREPITKKTKTIDEIDQTVNGLMEKITTLASNPKYKDRCLKVGFYNGHEFKNQWLQLGVF